MARSSVSFSTAYAPPAGSATRATCDSDMSSARVLRAIRRPNASGAPSGLSNGSTVTASAPPTPAANAATVVRSMLTHGSYLLSIGRLVTACWCCARSLVPLSSSTRRPQSPRGAQLGDGRELLVGRGVAELDDLRGLVEVEPEHRSGYGGSRRRRPASGRAPARQTRRGRGPRSRRRRRRARRPATPARPARGSAPRASRPRLVRGCSSRPSAYCQERAGAGLGRLQHHGREVEQHAVEQSVAQSVSSPASSHSEVTPPSRSVSSVSLSDFSSVTARCARMSQSPARVGRPAVTRPSSSSGVPSGVMPMPSSVVRRQRVPDPLVRVLVGRAGGPCAAPPRRPPPTRRGRAGPPARRARGSPGRARALRARQGRPRRSAPRSPWQRRFAARPRPRTVTFSTTLAPRREGPRTRPYVRTGGCRRGWMGATWTHGRQRCSCSRQTRSRGPQAR